MVNWDLPDDAEDYVHRIGRTARAGAGGKAISLVDEASALRIEAIEKFIRQKIAVDWADDDVFVDEIMPTAEERRRYAEERRARLAGRRDGGHSARRGDRRDRDRRGETRPSRPSPAPHPPAAPPAPGGPEGAARRRRRRRRRGPRPETPPTS